MYQKSVVPLPPPNSKIAGHSSVKVTGKPPPKFEETTPCLEPCSALVGPSKIAHF